MILVEPKLFDTFNCFSFSSVSDDFLVFLEATRFVIATLSISEIQRNRKVGVVTRASDLSDCNLSVRASYHQSSSPIEINSPIKLL